MSDSQMPLRRALLWEWPLKLSLGLVLGVIYWTGYFFIERHPLYSPIQFKLLPIDRWTGFSPLWAWGYQSVYPLLPLPFLATKREDIHRYAGGFILIMLAAFGCFILLPVLGPRPAIVPTTGMYGLVSRYDLPFNNLPSLHMAVATYSACAAIQVTEGKTRRVFIWVLPIVILLIGYSALATKQHYAVDLPPGIVLGWIAWRAAWFGTTATGDPRRQSLAFAANAPVRYDGEHAR
jgi:membrane-associated phospholipid phosphatase